MNGSQSVENLAPGLFGAPAEALLSPDEVAARLGVNVRTLARWRMTGKGPAFCRVSRKVIRYTAGHLAAYIASRIKASTAA